MKKELDETNESVLEKPENEEPKKEKVKKELPQPEPTPPPTPEYLFEVRRLALRKLSGIERYAMLKRKLRGIGLGKEEAGYNSQYFYTSLQDMQDVFIKLEEEFSLTSFYTEEVYQYGNDTGVSSGHLVLRNFAQRECIDLVTGNVIKTTKIDITNLKQPQDFYGIEKDVLRIATPKDAISTLLYDFLEPQGIGSISTYMQRYTYNQLYDFQETKADKVEQKGRLQDKEQTKLDDEPKKEKSTKEVTTPKTERLNDEAAEIRATIKAEFEKADIIEVLNGRKLATMPLEEATILYTELCENYTKKGEL